MKSQNKKTTEDDGRLSLSPLQPDPVTPSSNFVTKPLLAEPIQAPLRSTSRVVPGSFLPPTPPRAPPSQVDIVIDKFVLAGY